MAANMSERSHFVHPVASHARRKNPSPFVVEPTRAFQCFLLTSIVAACFAPIQDCDETFNYWEPTHYLSHGYGLQTWEYSPEFSIRSWFFISIHALVGSLRRLLPRPNKVAEFYFTRYVLALICALCQTLLYRMVSLTIHPRIGFYFLIALVLSPGNFHSSAAYLPSSFAMYMAMVGTTAFMNWKGGIRTSQGIFWFATGAVLGWPFAGVLCVPFVLEEVVIAFCSDKDTFFEAAIRLVRGALSALVLMALDSLINLFFYKKLVIVPWNIIKYNIFSNSGGPNLYGTEPWTFYFRNLLLNFNIWFILALLTGPLFLFQKAAISPSKVGFSSGLRMLVFISPFYLWFVIFTFQPHKEERFMYPAYPFLALNAAISLHIILMELGAHREKSIIGFIPVKVRLFGAAMMILIAAILGLTRIYGIWEAYSAPLDLYRPLGTGSADEQGVGYAGDLVCFGKEWYRFPSSYFLPRNMHAKFVRSEFRGLLPGEFSEAKTGFGFWSGTWLPTSGLNDRNEEDMGKYVDLRSCNFLIDTHYDGIEEYPSDEPDYMTDNRWEVLHCIKFLDAAKTSSISRALWIPNLPIVPRRLRRKWGKHCLLKKN